MTVRNLVLIGLVITLEPLPLTAFILILASKGGVQRRRVHLRLASVARDRDRVHRPRHRQQSSQAQHGSLPGRPRGQTRHRRRPDRDRDPAVQEAGQAETAEKPPQWQTGIDNTTPWYAIGLGPLTQPWALIAAGVVGHRPSEALVLANNLAFALFCVIATSSILAMETYAGFRPEPARESWPGRALDRYAYRPGYHHRVPGPRLLAGRDQHLLPHHLTAAFRRSPPAARPLITAASRPHGHRPSRLHAPS